MADVAVAGGGLVGDLTAVMLARRGHQVLVIDTDADPPDGTPEDDFFGWQRPGVPHSHHGHVFRARAGRVLRQEAPDVADAMTARGIPRAGFDFGPGFEDDYALMARRPVLEGVVRRITRAEQGVEVRTGQRVVGLTAVDDGAGVPRVVGVRTDGGEQVTADLVVDCCGRRSPAPKWLGSLGVALAVDSEQPCEQHYFARHYRLRPGADFPGTTFPDGAFTPYGAFLVMPQDNGTFALAGGLSKVDPCRHAFREDTGFERVMAALPRTSDWVATGTPITDVLVMGALANRRRCLVRDGRPVVLGYLLVGDSSLYTNATLGQGVALGFWQAQALAHRADLIGRDHPALVVGLEEWTDRVLGPWYREQVLVDEAMVGSLRAGVAGAPMWQTKDVQYALLAMGAQGDADAAAAFYRMNNLLSTAAEVLADPGLASRLQAFLAGVEEGPAGPGPLPRSQFEAMLSG